MRDRLRFARGERIRDKGSRDRMGGRIGGRNSNRSFHESGTHGFRDRGSSIRLGLAAVAAIGLVCSTKAQDAETSEQRSQAQSSAETTPESLFADFLHYARLGRFIAADAHARALLAHPDLDPIELLGIAGRDPKSLETLLIIIKQSSIGDTASRVLELIEQGEYQQRQDPERIRHNIDLLGGNPQQEYFARRHLAESGEYAVPQMIQALLDPARVALRSRIVSALPQIGKPAVNPLVPALAVDDEDVRQHVIHALGEIGYPQAIPYLRKLVIDESSTRETSRATTEAIERIESISGRKSQGSAQELFFTLAERYFDEDEAVRADPRLSEANVWQWDVAEQELTRIVVPTRIFGPVMAMRSARETLRLRGDDPPSIALWLAANIRRESRLNMNVQSADPNEHGEPDATRPDVFPRALYFTQAAGPRYAHLVLERAVKDNDSAVALGAIEALRVTAGESSLIGTEDYKQPLVQALRFPDMIVRIRAALALGAALPKSPFSDSEFVIPVLSAALTLSGREQILVIDGNENNLNRLIGALRGSDLDVIGEANFFQALERVRSEFVMLTGIFVATDIAEPNLTEALRELRSTFLFAKTPVVLLAKTGQTLLADETALADRFTESVDADADPDDMRTAFKRVRERTGQAALEPELARSLAMEAGESLRRIARDGRTVFDVGAAEPAMIAALSSPEEPLQTLVTAVLALLPTPTAQRAIAYLALDKNNTQTLRIAAFVSLAESSKAHGNQLEGPQVADLIRIAGDEPDLTMRTAASRTLGAINLATSEASEIIRRY